MAGFPRRQLIMPSYRVPYINPWHAGILWAAFVSTTAFLPVRSSFAQSGISLAPLTMSAKAQDNEDIRIVPAREKTLHGTISAMGTVSANMSRSITLRPAGEGKVLQVLVTPGEHVHTGQHLLDYVDHALHVVQLQYAQAQAALAAAKASSLEAEIAYRRGRLLDGTSVPTGEVQRRRAVAEEARQTIIARQADVGTIEHRFQEEFNSVTERIDRDEVSSLISPVDGVVQSIHTAVANDIKPGDPLLSVVDLSSVWVVAQVLPQDAGMLAIGGRVVVRPAGHEDAKPLIVSIATIDGEADPATGLVRVVAIVDHATGNLRPGEMLDATLQTTSEASGVVVPRAAVQRVGGQSIVYVRIASDRFQPHVVQTGLGDDTDVLVQGDVHPGDPIVTVGSFALKSMALMADMHAD